MTAVLVAFLLVLAAVALGVAIGAVVAWRAERQAQAALQAERHETWTALLQQQRDRISQLEYQLATIHARALKVPLPPPPAAMAPPAPPALPAQLRTFLEQLDDPEAREEFESDFRRQLAAVPAADPDTLLTTALAAG